VLSLLGQASFTIADNAAPVQFAEVQQIVDQRCHVCHATKPQFPGFAEAPKGIMFDTPTEIQKLAPQIMAQAVKTHTMPLGNVTQITDTERAALGAWIVAGAKLN
ncbi:MAG TPA: hypothetical protein VHA37_05915, partial [Candidatus Saccharimonadales bacterium]|nr:hypothetical protein [Candidatus Saccharimonadales bacterium]